MSGGVLGVAGDILSVAFVCFICSLAIQLYCAFSRRATRPPPPMPSVTALSSPPPQLPVAACKQLHFSRFQRSATSPVVSAVAPPSSPPNKLSPAYHVSAMACNLASPLACTVASQAHTADLAKLLQLESRQEQDVDAENFICVPPPRLLFTIKEEAGRDEDALIEQSNNMGSLTPADDDSSTDSTCREAPVAEQAENKCAANRCIGSTCALHGPVAALLSQGSGASSEGGVSLWSSARSSPAVSYLSASSSPFPTSSPPRSSLGAQTSRFNAATN